MGLGSAGVVTDPSWLVSRRHLLSSDWRAFSALSGRSDASRQASF